MAQLFHRRFGFLVQLGVLAAVLLIAVLVFVWRAAMAYPAGEQEALEQPVPFSHKHHVGDDGIDCRYCHSSVESSAFAGIPPLSTCMTCHSQLYTDQTVLAPLLTAYRSGVAFHWQRLHKLPDFVYFNHSIHIAKGVGCVSCHGQVDEMPLTARVAPLTMQWCLACHRNPAPQLRPADQVFNLHWHPDPSAATGPQLLQVYHIDMQRLTDCSICHR
ncbi:MAG TPA: cytochrome c3 family protein [Steroidobacteraceae bacterium]